ncbi:FeoA family protein [Sedimentibacter sp.]|uniref:FeoA family protein n=1 Tax=Sedimentibacter sp. TaxID=1960295 RepID=UPI0028A0E4F7|nr:FeoA family protein [Sedimentibacter sp.]
MALTMVAVGDTREVLCYRGKDEMKKRLYDLGLVKGEMVKVVGENQDGLILLVKGVKIAINKGLASLIMVK